MDKFSGLKAIAEKAKELGGINNYKKGKDAGAAFQAAATPTAILALLAELEAIRSDASQVFKEIGNELGCNPDNESIMVAIDDLKATQMTGPLKDVLKRNIELEAYNFNLREWNAWLAQESCELRAKLATPVRLSNTTHPRCRHQHAADIRAAGFTVGDE